MPRRSATRRFVPQDIRREVDWPLIEGAARSGARAAPSMAGRLGRLVMLAEALPQDAPLFDLAWTVLNGLRTHLAIERCAFFFAGAGRKWLHGLVGTDPAGNLVDERHLKHLLHAEDDRLFTERMRAQRTFEILEDVPLVQHDASGSHVVAHGWLAKIPIVHEEGFALVYTDAAFSQHPPDPLTQEIAVAFLALVAPQLHQAWRRAVGLEARGHGRLVARALEILHADPSVSHEELADALETSVRTLSDAVERELGVRLMDARNARRLELVFRALQDTQRRGEAPALLDIALKAGFGSYSQFQRVFRAFLGCTPRAYLAARSAAEAQKMTT